MDINQIITNMKTTDLFQPILLFALFLCGLTACNDSDEIRLSPFQETTVKGEASTLQIDLTYIIHSGFISGYQNRYGDNLKPPTNVYHRMTA